VRAKFFVNKKIETTNGFEILLDVVVGGSEENKEFFKYTPSGQLHVSLVKKETADFFEIGKEYFLDFTKVS
jgi:hypothetical protein